MDESGKAGPNQVGRHGLSHAAKTDEANSKFRHADASPGCAGLPAIAASLSRLPQKARTPT
jgi:hypothetical protein